ncbi:MAG: HDOD domain-containing protein [Phycisphaerales bacterium]|jgi:putative nucleotidyltransferase with HDIG domain|nr:HDOD domain-containing protein [Phycisphaerales bacterium]
MSNRSVQHGQDDALGAWTDKARQVELVLQQVDALPTLSPIATRLLSLSSAEDAELDEIATLIESDPALTVRILSMCRRADKGLSDRITSVKRAVVMLGLEAVQSAVLSVSVFELMGGAEGEREDASRTLGPVFDRPGFWRHSIAVACAAELVAERHSELGVRPDEAFVGGLLHDIGKLVLDMVLPRAYARVLALAERRGADSAGVERGVIGIDHHTAARRLAERWGLPRAVQDVVWLHGQSRSSVPEGDHAALIGLVTVGRALCRGLHLGWSGDYSSAPDVAMLCGQWSLDESRVGSIHEKLIGEVASRCASLGLENRSTPELLLQSIAQANRRLSRMNETLSKRSALAAQQARALDGVAQFHDHAQAARPMVETLGDVARSAGGLLGTGFYAIVLQERPGATWQVFQFTPTGELERSCNAEPPRSMGGERSLAVLTRTGELSVSMVALLPWMEDYLGDACDIRTVRVLALTRSDGEGPAAVLLHDRELSESTIGVPQLRAVTATWGAAIAASSAHEEAMRLGERLATLNRSLAEAQTRLSEAESLARLGEMAAGAAHEMNNPLTVIRGRAQLLARRLTDERDRVEAEGIARAARDLTELITSLHVIADPPRPSVKNTDPMEVARAAVARAEDKARQGHGVKVIEGEGLGTAAVDPEILGDALSELVANAMEADARDYVELRVTVDSLEDRLLFIVSDRGPGLSERAGRHAFDPFFSEKPAGRQTGLGLTRARRLAEVCGGEITLASAPGRGTVATLAIADWRAISAGSGDSASSRGQAA